MFLVYRQTVYVFLCKSSKESSKWGEFMQSFLPMR